MEMNKAQSEQENLSYIRCNFTHCKLYCHLILNQNNRYYSC
jgi:hypothetical protein